MKKFLGNLLSSFLGAFAALMTVFLVIYVVIVISIGGIDKGGPIANAQDVLHLKLNVDLVEKGKQNPLQDLDLPILGLKKEVGLVEILKVLDDAKNDESIKAVFLDLSGVPAGYGMVEDIRQAILDFRESEKNVYAYGEMMSEKAYYLASAADQIYLPPSGMIEFKGISAEVMFYKDLLERLELEPKIFRVGKFKSAIEPFIRTDMSEANRTQIKSFIESIYRYNLEQIAESRNLNYDDIRLMSDSLLVRNIDDAVRLGLVDKAYYFDEVIKKMKADLNISEEGKIRLVSMEKYQNENLEIELEDPNKPKVAVIIGMGDIMPGQSEEGSIGSSTIAAAVRKARQDDNVKAIVVRINSPGGSALASDIMWREISLASEKKPTIASMSTVAASGGYYMAMSCDTIVAQPNTITGSIGVFGLLVNAEKFLSNKIGVTTDRVKTGAFSDLGSPTRQMTDDDSIAIQTEVNHIYEDFTTKAAKGRGMNVDDLKDIAGGRVWTGQQGLENGLVDILGGLQKAIEVAANSAGISENYEVAYFPKEQGFFGDWGASASASIKNQFIEEELGDFKKYLLPVEDVMKMQGVQARVPFELHID